jgi:hypothetical protein
MAKFEEKLTKEAFRTTFKVPKHAPCDNNEDISVKLNRKMRKNLRNVPVKTIPYSPRNIIIFSIK